MHNLFHDYIVYKSVYKCIYFSLLPLTAFCKNAGRLQKY